MTALDKYFKGVASKYLSHVDAKGKQHEIGSNKFTAILGNPGTGKNQFKAVFLRFADDSEELEPEVCEDVVTFYDTRLNQQARSAELRLYYRANPITGQFEAGDFCLIGVRTDDTLVIATAHPGSDDERRLRYLFNVDGVNDQWTIDEAISSTELDLASRRILQALGIEPADEAPELMARLVEPFGLKFPTTSEFSAFARSTLDNAVSASDDPDGALEAWMLREEALFRALERNIVGVRLQSEFASVDEFVAFSLSVQNRRKSRVGHALEHHLEATFKANGVQYQRGARTEGNARPDFLFPNAGAYHDTTTNSPPLQMLAAKSTCKDRWRQILAEAQRIPVKHLFTLETAISTSQTDEMARHAVRLVLPPSVRKTYTQAQQPSLMSLSDFIAVLARFPANAG